MSLRHNEQCFSGGKDGPDGAKERLMCADAEVCVWMDRCVLEKKEDSEQQSRRDRDSQR
jgi:hypothetical protein